MLVKDSRSPRGRHELDVQRTSVSHIRPITSPLPPGASWRDSYSYLFARAPRPASEPRPLVAMRCEVCHRPFTATNGTLARMCGATCRKRAQKARERAAA